MPVYEVTKNNKTGKHDSLFKQFIRRDLSVRSVLVACAILSVCLFAFSIDFIFICRSWDKKRFLAREFQGSKRQVYTRDTFYAEITVTTKKRDLSHATSKLPCTSAIVRELCRGQDLLARGVLIYSVNDCMQHFLQYSQTCLFNRIRDCLRRYRAI